MRRAGREICCGPPASEEAMTEFRRLKLKIGEAEFEADVPENKVQPMYAQFLFMLERRSHVPIQLFGTSAKANEQQPEIEATVQTGSSAASLNDAFDQTLLTRIFDLRENGAVTLKVLPNGPDKNADAMLLLLYGYYRLKNEGYVLATELFRAAEQSGISLRRPANEYVRNGRFVVRGGQRKGSHYSLNSQGLAMAKEITAKILE
jgi:hypothetical protein